MKNRYLLLTFATVSLVSCSVFNFDDYCSEKNLLELSGEVAFLRNEVFCIKVNENDLRWFRVYSLKEIDYNINIGDTINFITIIENHINFYLFPILQITVAEEELLSLENGITNYRDWYENFYID